MYSTERNIIVDQFYCLVAFMCMLAILKLLLPLSGCDCVFNSILWRIWYNYESGQVQLTFESHFMLFIAWANEITHLIFILEYSTGQYGGGGGGGGVAGGYGGYPAYGVPPPGPPGYQQPGAPQPQQTQPQSGYPGSGGWNQPPPPPTAASQGD